MFAYIVHTMNQLYYKASEAVGKDLCEIQTEMLIIF